MNAHTPGPWTAERTPEDGALPWAVMTNDGLYVATPHTNLSRSTELEANARLIAASPTMYEALRRIAFEPFGPSDASHADVLEAITALARQTVEAVNA